MAYVFLDLPADSADLETYNGYHVARSARVASGGPVKRDDPTAGPNELLLHYPAPSGSYRPRSYTVQRAANALTRFAPGKPFFMGRFLTAPQLASLVSVPGLCFALVWLIGKF